MRGNRAFKHQDVESNSNTEGSTSYNDQSVFNSHFNHQRFSLRDWHATSSRDQSNLKSMVYISSLTKTDNETGAIKTYRECTVSTTDGLCILLQGMTVLIVGGRS